MTRLLEIQGLEAAFPGDSGPTTVVHGASLDVERGETVGLVGESGSGKTATALSVLQLLPAGGRVVGGSVTVNGAQLVGAPPAALKNVRGRVVAMVFQDSMSSLNPLLTIGRQITETVEYHTDMDRAAARERALRLLTEVGVPEPEKRLGQFPYQLSGGLRQRAAVAVALAADPELLIADEPTTALDVTVQAELLELLRREQKERHMGVLLITHDLGVVARVCDRVAVMYAGRIVEEGPADALFSDPRHPYTRALLRSVPRIDVPRSERLRAIDGQPPPMDDLPQGCPFAPRCPHAFERCAADPTLEPVAHGNGAQRVACWADPLEGR